jgi:hypothetical protein
MTARPPGAGFLAGIREHFAVDLRTLALFRIGLAAITLVDLFDRSREIRAHYTDFGIVPRESLRLLTSHRFYSLHALDGGEAFQIFLVLVAALFGVLMLVGLFTRTSTVASFVLLASIQNRNPLVNHAGDVLQLALLLWALFLPLGRFYSLDARRRGRPPSESRYFSVATLGLLLQPVFLYAVATVSKLQFDAWHEGRALYAVLHKASYVRPLGEFALEFPWLVEALTYGTLVVEASVPVLLLMAWRRDELRVVAFGMNFAFQVGIWSLVSIGVFQPLAILCVLPYLPGKLWDRVPALRVAPGLGDGIEPDTSPDWLRSSRDALAGLLLVYVTATNLAAMAPDRLRIRDPFDRPGRYLHLEQRWRVFANADETRQGWWVVVGHLQDGRRVDALNLRDTVSFDRPVEYAYTLPNNNWRIYWSRISGQGVNAFRPYLADYFCRRWNEAPRPGGAIVAVEVIHMAEVDVDPSQDPQLRPVPLIQLRCR